MLALIGRHVADPERHHVVLAGRRVRKRQAESAHQGARLQEHLHPARRWPTRGPASERRILAAHRQPAVLIHTGSSTSISAPSTRRPRSARRSSAPAFRSRSCRTAGSSGGSRELLHEGHIIARYQGRMEFGPRALGNRSILYHAKDPAANDWLNEQLRALRVHAVRAGHARRARTRPATRRSPARSTRPSS